MYIFFKRRLILTWQFWVLPEKRRKKKEWKKEENKRKR